MDCNEEPHSSGNPNGLYLKLENNNFIMELPPEILYKIFKSCSLRDQLVLAKVCQLFREIIRDIWQKKFKLLNYNYLDFKYMKLNDYEISQLCYLVGKGVERVRYCTFFDICPLKDIEWCGTRISSRKSLENFVNDDFKRNIKYFKNLEQLEVEGKFLQDQTILVLSKYCKKLKTLRLMDNGSRSMKGKYLEYLRGVENLELKSCFNLDPYYLLMVSKRRQLKSLNIVECEHLYTIPKIIKLSNHWKNLETLRLTAFTQDNMLLRSIINLPALKILQFCWIKDPPFKFEENFFLELGINPTKSLALKHLKFKNELYYIDNDFDLQANGRIVRHVFIDGQSWRWSSDVFDKISINFKNFKNLHTLSFYNCRLSDYKQIKHLSLNSEKLELIRIIGSLKRENELLKKEWVKDQALAKCKLSFQSCVSSTSVRDLQEEANSNRFPICYHPEPTMHSIECQFY